MDLSNLGLFGLFIGTFLSATVVPFSSDALYIAALAVGQHPWECLLVATAGNWLGGCVTFGMGWLGRWEWLEKWFRVKRETLEKQQRYVDKYGVWLALVSWVPIIGDVLCLALGFYKAKPVPTIILLLVGKAARFVCWTLFFI